MRAFVFSLDAFIAFTLALVAIYSLVFFSSIPTSYYYLLTQGHYLTRDSLMALSTTRCSIDYGCDSRYVGSILDRIAANDRMSAGIVQDTVGRMIPVQFGYRVEVSDDGSAWNNIYDTSLSTLSSEAHAKTRKKLSVSSQVLSFGYSARVSKPPLSPYRYLSCNGEAGALGGDSVGSLITCGDAQNRPPEGAGGDSGPSDLVPSASVKIVRLTVFI